MNQSIDGAVRELNNVPDLGQFVREFDEAALEAKEAEGGEVVARQSVEGVVCGIFEDDFEIRVSTADGDDLLRINKQILRSNVELAVGDRIRIDSACMRLSRAKPMTPDPAVADDDEQWLARLRELRQRASGRGPTRLQGS